MSNSQSCIYTHRKIPEESENFIDNYILKSIEYLAPYIMSITTTPNIVTIFRSILLCIMSYIYIESSTKKNAILFISIYFINYYLDCVDGYLARKCNKMTKLGDWLDHVSDILSFAIYFFIMYPFTGIEVAVIVFLALLMCIHLGNQQKLYKKRNNKKQKELLDAFMEIDIVPISVTKYFGCGTLILGLIVIFINRKIMQ